MDYSKGKIYRILNNVDDDCYIGSTTQPLSKRMAVHRKDMNAASNRDRLLYIKMRLHGAENFYIELVEEYPCENVEQLRKREGHYIREMGTLNKLVSGRSTDEWRRDSFEHRKAWQKQYDTEHREKKSAYKKDWLLKNAEKMREWKLTPIQCECGITYTQQCRSKHVKTKRHLSHMEQSSGDPE
jgi:group I intron endonuclease